MPRNRLPLLLVLALLAAGCGKSPASVPPHPLPTSAPVAPGASPATPGGAPGLLGPGRPGPVLADVQRVWSTVHTLSAGYTLWEKGDKVETDTVQFKFQKPGQYRYEVSTSSDGIKSGSTSVFDTQSRNITSHLGGVASFFPIKGTLDDDRAKSPRGYTLDKTDYATQIEEFLAPGAAVRLATPPGYPTEVLELAHPAKTPDVDTLRMTLDPQKRLATAFEMTAGGQVVYRKHFSNLQINPAIASDQFTL